MTETTLTPAKKHEQTVLAALATFTAQQHQGETVRCAKCGAEIVVPERELARRRQAMERHGQGL